MRKNTTFKKRLTVILFISLTLTPYLSIFGEASATQLTGTIVCSDASVWLDEHWQFYKVIVDEAETVTIQVDYEGTLDLDVRLYWKRDNPAGFNGFDVSHCDIDDPIYVYKDNSQLRTINTTALGQSETLTFTNPSYTQVDDKTAYILVFLYNGTGSSSYTISCTKLITEVLDDDTYDCNQVFMFLIIYIALAGIVFALFSLFLRNKNLKITGRKKQKKAKEAEQQKPDEEEGGVKHVDLDTIVR